MKKKEKKKKREKNPTQNRQYSLEFKIEKQ